MNQTIFVTISRGVAARNILQTDVYKKLKESGARIVILTPACKDERFLKEFSAPNVFFENLIEPKWSYLDRILVGWHKALVYNKSTELRDRYGIYSPNEGNIFKYLIKKIIFWPLSKVGFLKVFARRLDAALIKDIYHKDIFDKYNPDLVFATSVMEDGDVFVLKQAKARGIKTIGAVKSWDNISKMSFRVKVDKLLVWGDYSAWEAKRFQNYKDNEIVICGAPQFDFYYGESCRLVSREEFRRSLSIDPRKRLILFASGGKVARQEGEVAQMIADCINAKVIENAIMLIRPHFAYQGDEKKFAGLEGAPNVIIDTEYNRSSVFRDHWDYSKKQINRYTNIIGHADVIIASASTVSLDAAAFNKPIINIAFDGYNRLPFRESIARGYTNEHNSRVLETGGIWLVKNKEELILAIKSYLANPSRLLEGRERLKECFCYKIDGLAGARMAAEILKRR